MQLWVIFSACLPHVFSSTQNLHVWSPGDWYLALRNWQNSFALKRRMTPSRRKNRLMLPKVKSICLYCIRASAFFFFWNADIDPHARGWNAYLCVFDQNRIDGREVQREVAASQRRNQQNHPPRREGHNLESEPRRRCVVYILSRYITPITTCTDIFAVV